MKAQYGSARQLPDIVQDVRRVLIERLSKDMSLLILYGSEARGEAGPDSDVDLIVILERSDDALKKSVQDAVYDVMWERDFDRLISAYVISKEEFDAQKRRGFSFIRSVERDGVVLWQAA